MDPLDDMLERLAIRAQVFHTGWLCTQAPFDGERCSGYLHLLRRGRLRVHTGDTEELLQQPTLLFYSRPLPHRFVPLGDGAPSDAEDTAAEPGADLVCARLQFDGSPAHPLFQHLPAYLRLPLHSQPGLQPALELLFAEADRAATGRASLLARLAEVVVILMLRHAAHAGLVSAGMLAGLGDAQLARALQAVHARPEHDWSLDEAAALAAMSRSAFAQRFRSVLGSTFADYVLHWRLSLAQGLLRRDLPVKRVAQEVGYANASALARAFARCGLPTPQRWRRGLAPPEEG